MIRALLLAAALVASAHAAAQSPQTIAYQGYLTTTGGVPVDASVEMHFALYASAVGGTPVWSESQAVPVANGAYSVVLGAITPLPDPFLPPLYLGVRIGTDAEMAPRQAIAAAPFALFAERARCNPGDIIGCSGAPGSVNVGACLAGKRVCNEQGTGYGPCAGQQDPMPELCDSIDNDCDGVVDNGATCVLPNAQSAACQSGGCVVVSCAAGFFNCDGNHANGCETMGSGCS
jgi:hypothetical protein